MSDNTVSQHINHLLSFTFRVGALNNQYCKINLELNGIDVNSPLEPQMEKYNDAVSVVWNYMLTKVNEEISKIQEVLAEQGTGLFNE